MQAVYARKQGIYNQNGSKKADLEKKNPFLRRIFLETEQVVLCLRAHKKRANHIRLVPKFMPRRGRRVQHFVCARHGTYVFQTEIYTDYPEGANPLWASWRSPLVSCKGVSGDRRSEGSRTTRVCTDEQKLHMRHDSVGKQAHLCEARSQ